ncbi:MAG: aminotransferase class V-fold PLP-dependent enzyme [Rhizonema sp. NSF051]|nr:aminotransferase class V-fold PLP-dependent enzyme [Rhizonema sp. NSF051]
MARDRYRLRPDARRFENWETNYATKIGLGVAIDYALKWSLEAIWSRISALATTLRAQLDTLRGVTVWDLGIERCGIVSFTVDAKSPKEIRYTLAQQSINVSVSTLNSTRLDMDARGITELVRASVHYYNSEEEVERFCAALASVL